MTEFSPLEEYLSNLIGPALNEAIEESRAAQRERLVEQMTNLAACSDPEATAVADQLRVIARAPIGVWQVHLDPGNDESHVAMEFFVRDPRLRGDVRVKVLYDAPPGEV